MLEKISSNNIYFGVSFSLIYNVSKIFVNKAFLLDII